MTASKPIILLDMDGVMVDKTQVHLDRVNKEFGTSYHYEDTVDWHYSYMTQAQRTMIYNSWHDPKLYDNDSLNQEQLQTLEAMRQLGRVVACTSPMAGHATSKYKFLLRYFEVDDIIMCKDKTLVRGDALIDDGAHNIEAFTGVGPDGNYRYGILYNRPWNQHLADWAWRVDTFSQIPEAIYNALY